MLITYQGNGEVIITTSRREKKMLKDWFKDGDRDVDMYDRVEHKGSEAVQLEANLSLI